MPARLPPVLSRNDLPTAELIAARLDGEVYAIDDCFSPIDEPESGRHRALSLVAALPGRLIAEQRTAAWVFCVIPRPPARHQFCVDVTARARPPASARLAVREVVVDPEDLVECAGLPLTSPLRTAVDLARFSDRFADEEQTIVRRLAALGGFGLDECRALLDRRRNLPAKRLAFARLRAALERQPPVTR